MPPISECKYMKITKNMHFNSEFHYLLLFSPSFYPIILYWVLNLYMLISALVLPIFFPSWSHSLSSFYHLKLACCCLVAKLHLSLCDPMDYNLTGSSVHGMSQAKILEWVAISSCTGSSQSRDQTHVSCIGRQILYHWATREALYRSSLASKWWVIPVLMEGRSSGEWWRDSSSL